MSDGKKVSVKEIMDDLIELSLRIKEIESDINIYTDGAIRNKALNDLDEIRVFISGSDSSMSERSISDIHFITLFKNPLLKRIVDIVNSLSLVK